MLQEWEHDESRMPQRFILAFDSYLSTSYIQCLDDPTHDLSIVLEDGVNMISSISTKKGKPSVSPYDLAKRWGIGLETVKKTLLRTTQRGLRTVPNPLLSQRYRTNDQMFRYKRLSTTFLLIQCWLGSSRIAGTLVHKFMLTGTHGVRHIL